jgi:D-glycero-D-manno-heptose 1,7-bisphosphate phosphatase
VLNRAAPIGEYILHPRELELLEGAAHAVRRLNRAGTLVLVVSNQRCVARGLISEAGLERVHAELRAQLAAQGARVDGIYHCPHELGSCDCRKPGVGMFLQAQADQPEIVLSRAVVIGDSDIDMEASDRIGARGVLICSEPADGRECAPSLYKAVELLLDDQDPARA